MPPIYLALGAAVIWGIYFVFASKVVPQFPPHLVLLVESVVAAILCSIALYFWPVEAAAMKNLTGPSAKMLLLVAFLSFAATFLIIASLGEMNATTAALVEISYPVFIVLFAWLIFGENHLSIPNVIGGVFILLGVGVISLYGDLEEETVLQTAEQPAVTAMGISIPHSSDILVSMPAPHLARATVSLRVKLPRDLLAQHPTGSLLEVSVAA